MVYGHDACIPKKCGQPSGCTQDIFVCTLYSSIPNGEIIKRNSPCYCPFIEQREQFLSAELHSMTRKWWKFGEWLFICCIDIVGFNNNLTLKCNFQHLMLESYFLKGRVHMYEYTRYLTSWNQRSPSGLKILIPSAVSAVNLYCKKVMHRYFWQCLLIFLTVNETHFICGGKCCQVPTT